MGDEFCQDVNTRNLMYLTNTPDESFLTLLFLIENLILSISKYFYK